MIITIVTIVAVAATIFGYIAQMKKMNKWKYSSEEKDSVNKILRAHMNNVESELKASANHIKILQSELQSLKDKAKAVNQKPKLDSAPKTATQPNPHQLLFQTDSFSSFNPNPDSKTVGSGIFLNSTRVQVRDMTKQTC